MLLNKTVKLIFTILLFFAVEACNPSDSTVNEEIVAAPTLQEMAEAFSEPAAKFRPETWFHFNGNNISKEGITLDLEAIKEAGLQGIHLFSKNGRPYPGVEQIKILSPEWEDMVRHAADECQRLGLKFTMQNCPGWSMTGGPWVPVEEAQREIVESIYYIKGGEIIEKELALKDVYLTEEYDYKDVQVLAFPTPEGEDVEVHLPTKIETNNPIVPWSNIFNPEVKLEDTIRNTPEALQSYKAIGITKVDGEYTWVKVKFDRKVTIRSIKMSPIRNMILDRQYPRVDVELKVQAVEDGQLKELAQLKIPSANWQDRQLDLTLAIPETKAEEFVLSFIGDHDLLPADIHWSSKPRLHNHQAKAAKAMRSLEKEIEIDYDPKSTIRPDQIINLTNSMNQNGQLNWAVPPGDWTIVRFGHVNMRRTNKPAMPESTGWESSKLDKIAIENHLRNGMIGQMIKDGGPIGDGKLDGLLIDSWESFIPTWTIQSEGLFKEFKQRRGYNMRPYLPATLGYIIGSAELSTKFLRDLRQTIDEVYVDNFFAHFATIAHEMGAKVYTEGAGGEVLPVDPMRYYGVSDYPMTEFWYPKAPSSQNEYGKPIFPAASAVHLYNKAFLACEAATQLDVNWSEHPYTIKYLIDYNFTKGVNHLVFHTFSHTPQKEVFPGSSFAGKIGFPFVRQQTWWQHMPEFVDYLSRCQYLLQKGEYAADVLWYLGDQYERPPFDLDAFPKGYRFDYLNAEILQERLSMKASKIHAKDAGDYRIILLRDSKNMLLSTAKRLKELVMQGAVILGDKPLDSPSLMDDKKDLTALKKISDELWGSTASGSRSLGEGKVYWGQSLEEVLKAESIEPDVIVPETLPITWIHRKTAEADIYFVSSTSEQAMDVALSFRVADANPQLWDPFTGKIENAQVWSQEEGRTNVTLSLPPSGSAMLVFSKANPKPPVTQVAFEGQTILDSQQGWFRLHDQKAPPVSLTFLKEGTVASKAGEYTFTKSDNTTEIKTVQASQESYNEDWKLQFSEGWDVPASYDLSKLISLSDLKDETIRHYSGTIIYQKQIEVQDASQGFLLDLGAVHNIAELWLNGERIGTRWAPPYRFDLTGKVKEGSNQVEIQVTNTWRNQLIYDNSRPEVAKKTWTTNPPEASEASEKDLDPSGIVGPIVATRFIASKE